MTMIVGASQECAQRTVCEAGRRKGKALKGERKSAAYVHVKTA
jgi:hypothetical protein